MVTSISGFWISVIAPSFFIEQFTTDPFPPGTNVYGSISLSQIDTLFFGNGSDPTFAAEAFITAFTFYESDGSQSPPQEVGSGADFTRNAILVNNCATITFTLAAERAAAIAQINIFML